MKLRKFINIILIGVIILFFVVGGYLICLKYYGPLPCAKSLKPVKAVNKKTGEEKAFKYPCAVPRGWTITDYDPITTPQANSDTQIPTPFSKITSEAEVITSLKTNWHAVQMSISFLPVYHNQVEDAKKIWRAPSAVQFIGKNGVLIRFEDDNNAHAAIFKFDNGKFTLLKIFKNQAEFSLSNWQDLVNKYGDSSYQVATYTIDLVQNKQIVSFTELTKVSENIFVENYWVK